MTETPTPVLARRNAFADLGTDVSTLQTGQEVLDAALLSNWNVRKLPLFTEEDGKRIPITDKQAIVRNHPLTGEPDPLGAVSNRYQEIQNEELITFLDNLVDESGANYANAGSTRGGRRVFVSMKLPDHMMIGGVDKVEMHLAVTTSHDGGGSVQTMATPLRMDCMNQLAVALRYAGDNVFRVRHTRNATQMVQQAREALDLTFKYLEDFKTLADHMVNVEMTDEMFVKMIEANFGAPDDAAPATITRSDNKIQQMIDIWHSPTLKTVDHTVWAGFNALTEWYDHFSPTRGDGLRAEKAAFNTSFKQNALEMVRA
jgi:phage/plasmid-like protein (TIGR03299 family)